MRRSEFEALVQCAIKRIPKQFRQVMDNLEILIQDWPDPGLVEEVTGDRKSVLYGLFEGVPLPEKRLDDLAPLPAVIHIYKGPLEQDFQDTHSLTRQVEITVVHEIAHYMGLGEEVLEYYGYG